MFTMRKVAKLAGVSIATVSHVVSGKRPVAPETRKRVMKVIQETGFRPSKTARDLTTNRSNTIGLIVGNITHPFMSQYYRDIEQLLRPHDIAVLMRNLDDDPALEEKHLEEFIGRRVDGIILFPYGKPQPLYAQCAEAGIPLVFTDHRPAGVQAPLIATDSYRAGVDATRYLIRLGHRRIALLTRDLQFPPFARRKAGYIQTMQAAALKPRVIVVPGRPDESIPAGVEAAVTALRGPDAPTAIIAGSHAMLLAAMGSVRKAGIRCPDDVSILGFDESPWLPFVDPPLTVMTRPTRAMCEALVQTMLKEISAMEPVRSGARGRRARRQKATIQRFPAVFVERESCAPPPGKPQP